MAPVSPTVRARVATPVLLVPKAVEEARQGPDAPLLLTPPPRDGVRVVGGGRRPKVGGSPVGGAAGLKEVAVLTPAIDAVVVEVVAQAEGVILAVAAEPTEVGVANIEVEAKGQPPVPTALKTRPRQAQSVAGVARAVVPVVMAHAASAGRARPRLPRAPFPVEAPRGPNGRQRAPHEVGTVPFVQGRVRRAGLLAETEGPGEVPLPAIRADYTGAEPSASRRSTRGKRTAAGD